MLYGGADLRWASLPPVWQTGCIGRGGRFGERLRLQFADQRTVGPLEPRRYVGDVRAQQPQDHTSADDLGHDHNVPRLIDEHT